MNYFIIFIVVVLAIMSANVLMQMLILPRIMPKAPMMQKPPMNTVLDEISTLIDLEILSILEVPMSIRRIPLITDYTEVQNEIVKAVLEEDISTGFWLYCNACGIKKKFIMKYVVARTNAKLLEFMSTHRGKVN